MGVFRVIILQTPRPVKHYKIKMLASKLKFRINHILARFKLIKIDWSRVFVQGIFFGVIVLLIINIYITFDKGVTTLARFEEEQAKLDAIVAENEYLTEQVKEYDSLEYKRMYARENLNLAHDNETIYYVDRPEELPEIEPLEEETMRITFNDPASYWLKLLFGR